MQELIVAHQCPNCSGVFTSNRLTKMRLQLVWSFVLVVPSVVAKSNSLLADMNLSQRTPRGKRC
jgi:hypothetical protein